MPKKAFIGPLPRCCIDGCNKVIEYITATICGMHSQRIRRYGDPQFVTTYDGWRERCREVALKYKTARPDVYKKKFNRHEHRSVAEEMLGRPLQPGEIVHHMDNQKHNNDPSNLQVMSRAEHLRVHRAEMETAKKAKRNATAAASA